MKFGVKLPDRSSFFDKTKFGENAKNEQLKCNFGHFEYLGLVTKHELFLT